jgi:hypothetical protein
VEYTREAPSGLNFVRKAAPSPFEPPKVLTVGKSLDVVKPVTMALPLESTAMLAAMSGPSVPPKKLEYTSAVPCAFNFATKLVGYALPSDPTAMELTTS